MEYQFEARIEIIGINPYVRVPDGILQLLFADAGKSKGPIPVCGQVNARPYVQTLVRYGGHWRLYINAAMLEKSPRRIGEIVQMTVAYDAVPRTIGMHRLLKSALEQNKKAKMVFDGLPPSRQKEIVRYIAQLKTDQKIRENVLKAIGFLLGEQSFIGRKKP